MREERADSTHGRACRRRLVVLPLLPSSNHPYSGNFHAFVLYANDDEFKLAQEFVSEMNRKAISLDGTCEFEFFSICLPMS